LIRVGKPEKLKRVAMILYHAGLGFPSLERFWNFSLVFEFNWRKSYREQLYEIRNANDIEVVEIKEMYTNTASKKTTVSFGVAVNWNEHKFVNCDKGENKIFSPLFFRKINDYSLSFFSTSIIGFVFLWSSNSTRTIHNFSSSCFNITFFKVYYF